MPIERLASHVVWIEQHQHGLSPYSLTDTVAASEAEAGAGGSLIRMSHFDQADVGCVEGWRHERKR